MSAFDKLLKKRDYLQKLANLSFKYDVINRKYPLTRIEENDYDYLLGKYNEILKDIISLANTIQYEDKDF